MISCVVQGLAWRGLAVSGPGVEGEMIKTTRPDMDLTCKACGVQPHRFQPSTEAEPYWRCSSCGEVTPGPEDAERSTLDRFFTDAGVDPRDPHAGLEAERRSLQSAQQASDGAAASVVHPPSGKPFETVGTLGARYAIEAQRIAAGRTLESDADHHARLLLNLLAHRDHLAAQVTEIQTHNTALLERVRKAEAALHRLEASCAGKVSPADGAGAIAGWMRGEPTESDEDRDERFAARN